MKAKNIRTKGLDVSVTAQRKFDDMYPDRNLEHIINQSVLVEVDDEYGDGYSPCLLNENLKIIMPLRNRDNENGWGIPTVLDSEGYYIKGNPSKCNSCTSTWHSNRDECPECEGDVSEMSAFYWRGIEITSHCQMRAVERLDITPSNVEGELSDVLEKGVFSPLNDRGDENTISIINEVEGVAFPVRNKDSVEGVGLTTAIPFEDMSEMVDEDVETCLSCDKLYHSGRSACPFC